MLHSQLNSNTHVQNLKGERALDNVTEKTKFHGMDVGRANGNVGIVRARVIGASIQTCR